MVAIGLADGLHVTVVYTDRESTSGQVTRRIISAPRSSRHERKIYQKSQPVNRAVGRAEAEPRDSSHLNDWRGRTPR